MTLSTNIDYQNWLLALKQQEQQSQQTASLAVNAELVTLYWSVGNQIVQQVVGQLPLFSEFQHTLVNHLIRMR